MPNVYKIINIQLLNVWLCKFFKFYIFLFILVFCSTSKLLWCWWTDNWWWRFYG